MRLYTEKILRPRIVNLPMPLIEKILRAAMTFESLHVGAITLEANWMQPFV